MRLIPGELLEVTMTPGVAVFGKVTDGMEVVDKIASVDTGPGGPFRQDAPREMVVIETISQIKD